VRLRIDDTPATHLETAPADLGRPLGIAIRQFAADHRRDYAVFLDLTIATIEHVDGRPVADHRHRVGDAADLVQFVRDND
jgi:hypothetical protein